MITSLKLGLRTYGPILFVAILFAIAVGVVAGAINLRMGRAGRVFVNGPRT